MTNFMWYIAIVAAGLGGWKFGTVLGNIAVEWWADTSPEFDKLLEKHFGFD